MTRIALCDARGPLTDLLQKLSGDQGEWYLTKLKRMLRVRTVQDFKKFVETEWVKSGVYTSDMMFVPSHPAYRACRTFWTKLNRIGGRNFATQPERMAAVPDVDDTVELTDLEWAELEEEFHRLR
jgi:hypothetical protein